VKVAVQQGSTLQQQAVEVEGVLWVVIYDKFDQPIAAIEQMGDLTVHVATVSDSKFTKIIERLAPDKAVPVVRTTGQ
jgi:hypothetical protein